jgi:hypothetical protein
MSGSWLGRGSRRACPAELTAQLLVSFADNLLFHGCLGNSESFFTPSASATENLFLSACASDG